MNDVNTFPSNFELEIQAALAVPDADPQFVDTLKTRLMGEAKNLTPSQMQSNLPAPRRFRLAWGIPLILFALLTLTTLLVGPRNVWAAVQRMFGYMPGVGYVQTDGQVWVLEEPVTQKREGIQVTVEQVVADGERTVLLYKVEGLSLQAANSQGEGVATGSPVALRLPDGTELSQSSGGGEGWGIGYRSRMVFEAMPENIHMVTLVIPRLQSMPGGAAPENWEIPLNLVPNQGEVSLLPVYEIEQPDVTAEQTPEDTPAQVEDQDPISFSLDRVVEMEDGFQFEGLVTWLRSEDTFLEFIDQIDVIDANGERVPAEIVTPDEIFNPMDNNQLNWALKTVGKNQPGPWTITLSSVFIRIYPEITFQIDLGDEPQVGQIWELDQTFAIGEQTITLSNITLSHDPNRGYGLAFAFYGEENLVDVSIAPAIVDTAGFYSGWGERQGDQHISGIGYAEIPTGMREFSLDGVTFIQAGSWQASWQPPETAAEDQPAAPAESGEACMTIEEWDQLKAQSPALPDDPTGKLLLLTHTGQNLPEISLTAPNGTQKQTYGIGVWISLSPDGKTIAVPDDADGIHLIDTATGENTLIPGTHGAQYPVWSPEGSEIAYWDWAQATIYRVRLDGSDLRAVHQGNDIVYVSDWTAEGNQIMYLAFGQGGMVIKAVGADNGQVQTWIQTENNKPSSRPNLSPDGQWIIYIDRVEGDVAMGIYAARIDGTERKLLIAGDNEFIGLGLGAWSPDGQWVALNVRDFRGNYDNPTPVLVNLSTCEVNPLFSLPGEAVGWGE